MMKLFPVFCLICVVLQPRFVGAQTLSVTELAKKLGFSDADIQKIREGDVISMDLHEGSEKELAGVIAVFFKKPVSELADIALEGKMLQSDPSILAHRGWEAGKAADEAFAALSLDPREESDELELYKKAKAGSKLNLSEIEIAELRKGGDVMAKVRDLLKARYEAYLKNGVKGIAPYARGGSKTASPAEELTLGIRETMAASPRKDHFNALLRYPADPLPDVVHRYFWFKQIVEDRPTFILAHRATRQTEGAALLTEEQYYVSHSYNSNFIGAGALAVEGGTLVFYVNRSFTDQVAGMGSGLKHGIGRKQMLSEVAANLKRIRQDLKAK